MMDEHIMAVRPEDYHKMKERYKEMGFAPTMCACDMNAGFVPMEKDSKDNLEMTTKMNHKRFDLG